MTLSTVTQANIRVLPPLQHQQKQQQQQQARRSPPSSPSATEDDRDHYPFERDLKAKFVSSPQKLLEELRLAIGPGQYYSVEMRHNVYKIRASTEFDLQRLVSSF